MDRLCGVEVMVLFGGGKLGYVFSGGCLGRVAVCRKKIYGGRKRIKISPDPSRPEHVTLSKFCEQGEIVVTKKHRIHFQWGNEECKGPEE